MILRHFRQNRSKIPRAGTRRETYLFIREECRVATLRWDNGGQSKRFELREPMGSSVSTVENEPCQAELPSCAR
jgi:hypothetical protein